MKTAAIILGWMIILRYLISIHEHLYTKAKLEQQSPSTTTTNSPRFGSSPEPVTRPAGCTCQLPPSLSGLPHGEACQLMIDLRMENRLRSLRTSGVRAGEQS
jgi:hypothetical protein